jgi:hypothetical protein
MPAEKKTEDQTGTESVFVCRPESLSASQRERWQTLLKQLSAAKQEVRELQGGYAFYLPANPSIIRDTSEWITYERLCCPFLDFSLEVQGEAGVVWLKLTGRKGVKEFLRSEFNIQQNP